MVNKVALYLQDAHDLRVGLDYVRYAEEKGVDAVWQALSAQAGEQVLRGKQRHLAARGVAGAGNVRRDDHVRQAEERVFEWQRLRLRHIKGGATDLTGPEGRDQCILVNDSATRCVDEDRRPLHERELTGADEPLGLLG